MRSKTCNPDNPLEPKMSMNIVKNNTLIVTVHLYIKNKYTVYLLYTEFTSYDINLNLR